MVTDGPLITVIDPTSYLSRPCNFAPRIHSIVVCFWQSVSWRHCFLRRTCTDCTPRGVRIHRIGGDIRMLSMLQVEEPRLKEIVEVNKIFNTHYVVNDTEQTKWGRLIRPEYEWTGCIPQLHTRSLKGRALEAPRIWLQLHHTSPTIFPLSSQFTFTINLQIVPIYPPPWKWKHHAWEYIEIPCITAIRRPEDYLVAR